MAKKILRVGFDLDGVILYNPVRIFRPIMSLIKPLLLGKKSRRFYFPQTGFEKFVWRILHKTSFIPASGLKDLKKMATEKKIEPYIITARYDFLKDDFHGWIKKIQGESFLAGYCYNKANEQPHIFKEKTIKNLKLDIFVEDNWGITQYLSSHSDGTKIFWIDNIFDRHINYPYKFSNLKKLIKKLEHLYTQGGN